MSEERKVDQAWLEEMIALAWKTGALPRKERFVTRSDGEGR
jgi:hypothetical protein